MPTPAHITLPWKVEQWEYTNRGKRLVIIEGTDALAEMLPLWRPNETEPNDPQKEVQEKAAHIVRCVNERHELLAALKGLLAEVQLHKLNVRKDFSLLNAHAYANKVLHNAEKES